jgi:hypothetical protein
VGLLIAGRCCPVASLSGNPFLRMDIADDALLAGIRSGLTSFFVLAVLLGVVSFFC